VTAWSHSYLFVVDHMLRRETLEEGGDNWETSSLYSRTPLSLSWHGTRLPSLHIVCCDELRTLPLELGGCLDSCRVRRVINARIRGVVSKL